MGLDINFRLDNALNAGLGATVAIEDFRDQGTKAQQLSILGAVPDLGFWFELGTLRDSSGNLIASVRANKWGPLYTPLTEWLKSKDIEWYET